MYTTAFFNVSTKHNSFYMLDKYKYLRFSLTFLLILSTFTCVSWAQKKPGVKLGTPREAVYSHLVNLQDESYFPDEAAKALSFKGKKLEQSEKADLARKLKQIYDGAGFYVEVEEIPNNFNYQDSSSENLHRYTVMPEYPEIYVERINGKWLYSTTTIKAIPAIHDEIYPLGSHKFMEWIGGGNQEGSKYLGLYGWQYLGLICLVVVGWLLKRVFTFLIERILTNILIKKGYQTMAKRVMLPVARPLSLYLILAAIFKILPVLQLPIRVSQILRIAGETLLPALLILVGYRLVDVLSYYLEKVTQRTETALDDQLIPLVRRTLRLLVILLGTIFAIDNLGYDITGLIAGISIGGLAVALAAQDTIKHLFGSFMIFVDRPFTIGDWIVADGIDGTVIEVGFRSTRIQTFHNSIVTVPNGKIADQIIDNMGLRTYRRYSTKLSITYDTPPELIKVFIEGLNQIVSSHPDTRKDFYHIRLNGFGASSLDILFYIFFQVPDWAAEVKAREEIMLEILQLAHKLGVRFAFPTTTIHIEDFPEKQSLTPNYTQTTEDWRAQLPKRP